MCSQCGAVLVLRHRKRDGEPFIACSGFPKCRFAADFHPVLARLSKRITELERELRSERERWPATPGRPSGDVDRMLKQLIRIAHPDMNDGHPVAEKLTKELNRMRSEL